MDALFSGLVASVSTNEEIFLAMIALLDKAETLANNGKHVSPGLAVLIGNAKQAAIEEFAVTNREITLAPMQRRQLEHVEGEHTELPTVAL